jgi:hypothetical protein
MKSKKMIALTLLVLLSALATPVVSSGEGDPGALDKDTAYFQGRGPGVKVQLRSRYSKIVFTVLTTTFYCVDSEGKHYTERLRTYLGNKGLLIPNVDWAAIGPIPIRHGRFKFRVHSDELFTWIEDFTGRANSKRISGRFRLHIDQEESDCRTGGYDTASQFVSFNAHRIKH